MKKEPYFDEAVNAYEDLGKIMHSNSIMSAKKGRCAEAAFRRLAPYEQAAVQAVYMQRLTCPTPRKRGALALRFAMDNNWSIRQVYYFLAKARKLYAEEAGLLKKGKVKHCNR